MHSASASVGQGPFKGLALTEDLLLPSHSLPFIAFPSLPSPLCFKQSAHVIHVHCQKCVHRHVLCTSSPEVVC
jgi:hypothetical protein